GRANYRWLLERLEPLVPGAFATLREGCSPYAFPISARRKTELLDHLARRGVIGGKLWEVPHPALPRPDFPSASAVRATIVGLPVHQELGPADLERIVDAVRTARAGTLG